MYISQQRFIMGISSPHYLHNLRVHILKHAMQRELIVQVNVSKYSGQYQQWNVIQHINVTACYIILLVKTLVRLRSILSCCSFSFIMILLTSFIRYGNIQRDHTKFAENHVGCKFTIIAIVYTQINHYNVCNSFR